MMGGRFVVRSEGAAVVEAARAGDEGAFAGLVEGYRRELRVHCYRMLGSFEDSEDLVQETFLRAWRRREGFEGRSTFRAWLYKIATNACLDFLKSRPKARQVVSGFGPGESVPPAAVPWLQPYPDALLEGRTTGDAGPEAAAVSRETIELAFLAAIQCLPPRQRAVLILRDVLGWPARDAAALLETSVSSVNSALQRARPTLRDRLLGRRAEWVAAGDPSEEERAMVERWMGVLENPDEEVLGALLREDARCSHQPWAGGNMTNEPIWYSGRRALIEAWSPVFRGPAAVGFKNVLVRANMQPAIASYIRAPGENVYRPFALDTLRVEGDKVAEVCAFHPGVFGAFDLPAELPGGD